MLALRRLRLVTVAACVMFLTACGEELVKVYGEQTEQDANEMVLILQKHDIRAVKAAEKTTYTVSVPASNFADAVVHLRAEGLPHPRRQSVTDLFPSGNMFSTPAELSIRARFALEQQISATLLNIPGIRSAEVIVAAPKESNSRGPKEPTSASVLLVFDPRYEVDGLVLRVRQFVKNSIPNLAIENISVSVFSADGAYTRMADRGGE